MCGSALMIHEVTPPVKMQSLDNLPPGVWRYRAFLPSPRVRDVVTLGEGGTPLLSATRLGTELALHNLLIKDESRNPTGSFIDRGCTVLVSLAREAGIRTCSCVTTGNLGASLAAYCAKAGLKSEIRIGPGVDRGKLYQMIAYGARIEASAKTSRREMDDDHVISVTAGNPYILEGEKTTCFEIAQELGWRTPDVMLVPVGTGGHLSMFWKAIHQLREAGLIDMMSCRLIGVRFTGSAPVTRKPPAVKHFGKGEEPFTELEESEPIFGSNAMNAVKESGGSWVETTVKETIDATALLARTEGIFAEPAAASVVASLQTAKARGLVNAGETIVCVITGAGLKDTKAISRIAKATKHVVVPEEYPVERLQVGATKLQLLHSLSGRSGFGYELWKDLSSIRRITTASVYQHLAELEEMGLVRKSGVTRSKGRERVLYELSRKGLDLLEMAGRFERE